MIRKQDIILLIIGATVAVFLGVKIYDMLTFTVGDTIEFGGYYQNGDFDADSGGGAMFSPDEPIEWIVLEKKQDKILIISKHCLQNKAYNETETRESTEIKDTENGYSIEFFGVPGNDDYKSTVESADVGATVLAWKTSSLRKWLNGEFADIAFDEEERKRIIPTSTDDMSKDEVFILSTEEAIKYFSSNKKRAATSTIYAQMLDVEYIGPCWSLRTDSGTEVDYVNIDGTVSAGAAAYTPLAIRPAMWIAYSK